MRKFAIMSAMVMTLAAGLPSTTSHAQTYGDRSEGRYDDYDGHDVPEHGRDGRASRDEYENRQYEPYAENDRDGRNEHHYRDDHRCSRGSKAGGTALGAIGGGVLGHIIAPRRKKLLGTVIGGLAGGVVGNQIADAKTRC